MNREIKALQFTGTWHIIEMEMWDEEYFNMEVHAYFKINKDHNGNFQFGLVSGDFDGEKIKEGADEKIEFTWEGNDECDPASGSGRLKLRDHETMEGKIKFHEGDSSKFLAKRVK